MTPRSSCPRIARRRRALPLRRGYSLAALFLLIATIAVLAAMASSLATSSATPWHIAIPNLIVGLLGGALIGGTIGIYYERKLRATAIGVVVGATTGVAGGALSVSEFSPYMAFVQSGILIGLAVVVRLMTSGPPRQPRLSIAEDSSLPRPWLPLAQANRPKLVGALLMALCTVAAVASLINSLRATSLAAAQNWSQVGAQIIVVLVALVVAVWLLLAALRSDPQKPQPTRSSPWD